MQINNACLVNKHQFSSKYELLPKIIVKKKVLVQNHLKHVFDTLLHILNILLLVLFSMSMDVLFSSDVYYLRDHMCLKYFVTDIWHAHALLQHYLVSQNALVDHQCDQ